MHFSTSVSPVDQHVTSSDAFTLKRDTILPDILIITGLENAQSPVWIKLVDILVARRIRSRKDGVEHETDKGFMVIWIRDERSIGLPGWLVRLAMLDGIRLMCV
jgi:hypothetical protein